MHDVCAVVGDIIAFSGKPPPRLERAKLQFEAFLTASSSHIPRGGGWAIGVI